MEISGVAITLVDRASMRHVDVNQTLCALVGRTRQELIGMAPMTLSGASRERLERDFDAVIADGSCGAARLDGHYLHRDGSLIPIETHRHALSTDAGWVIVGVSRPITGRTEAGRISAVEDGRRPA
jgi:PAS domain S-box-containing protein